MSVQVPPGSILVDHDLIESRLGHAFGLTVVGIVRQGKPLFMPAPTETVQAEDMLVLHGKTGDLEVLQGLEELVVSETSPSLTAELESQQVGATEVLLSPRTTLAGKTLADLLFREHYGLNVLAIWRNGRAHRTGLQDLPLQFGDAMLVYGRTPKPGGLGAQRGLPGSRPSRRPGSSSGEGSPGRHHHAGRARQRHSRFGAHRHRRPHRGGPHGARRVPEHGRGLWGHRVESRVSHCQHAPPGGGPGKDRGGTHGGGGADRHGGDLGPRWVVAALFLVTVLATQVIPTSALVVLMSPVALKTAADLHISPHLLMMTVAMAASASFASPLSHPAHLLVMGPGGYRFADYVKIGVPLTIIALVVCVWLLPIFWPA